MQTIFFTISICLFCYASICAYLYISQRNLIYVPEKEIESPENYGLHHVHQITLTTEDNLRITAWYAKAEDNNPTIIYLHGNAGNLGDRAEKITHFTNTGMGLLAVSYRGYGRSEGSPSEQGLYKDARAAIKYLIQQGIKISDIILYGESLGSGVAVQMATEYQVKAIVLEAPYTSISNRASELYPYIPVKLLLKDTFNSIDKIDNTQAATLIFHGYLDEVMPIEHGKKMLHQANEPKEAHFFKNIGHTDFDLKEITQIMQKFIISLKKPSTP